MLPFAYNRSSALEKKEGHEDVRQVARHLGRYFFELSSTIDFLHM